MILNKVTSPDERPRELPKPGLYGARIYAIIDMGSQPNKFKEGTLQRKVQFSWELDSLMSDARPFTVHRSYTASLNEKSNLFADLKGMLGHEPETPFDITSLCGRECTIFVAHSKPDAKGRIWPEISALMPIEGTGKKGPELKVANKPVVFMLDSYDGSKFEELPGFVKEKIMASPEWRAKAVPSGSPAPDEDIPF